ncbi:hypothetical protein K2V52_03435 [Staphylococcus nepalensis]|uniref:hypothetical protein n=1 Tax=Staphylococcus nepalensis TaxID=214473 RepID=UPI001E5A13E9|nr:hypothetical protein [Staphylococcus nepalensis]MCD8891015.1 hypothetical protein [Staphylococcus nepalensis]
MFALPAICDNCNTVFASSFVGGPGVTMIVTGSKSGPCPVCGSLGSVPDGTYDIINDIEATLNVDNGKDVFKLQRILNTASKQDSISSIQNRIKKETPQYESIIDAIEYFFTKTKNTLAAIATVSTLIFGVIGVIPDKSNSDENSTIKNQQEVIKEQRNVINDYKVQNESLKNKNTNEEKR